MCVDQSCISEPLIADWPGVRDNIETFGGDPSRGTATKLYLQQARTANVAIVTAIGQSVGASDIGLHLTSFNGTKGVPFRRAM